MWLVKKPDVNLRKDCEGEGIPRRVSIDGGGEGGVRVGITEEQGDNRGAG